MSKPINVVWYGNPEGTEYHVWWDMSFLSDLFDGKVINVGQEFIHYDGMDAFPDDPEQGAVVVVPARLWAGNEDKVNESLQRLKFVVLICCGNEEASFDMNKIHHPMLRIWMQLPRMNMHNDVSYRLPNGYRPETHQILKDIGQQPRVLDWFFAGQLNHDRRRQCYDVLMQFSPLYANQTIGTDSFGKESIAYPEYLRLMASAKVVPCPSGVESPDSFRLYEALEAGCIPVVDAFSMNHQSPGFWQYLFGNDIPFPIVSYWSDFPQVLPQLLNNYTETSNKVFSWWIRKKQEVYYKLINDVRTLNG